MKTPAAALIFLLLPLAGQGTGLAAAGPVATPAAAQRASRPEDLRFEPLRYKPPAPKSSTLPNGLSVSILEDRSLPLVEGVLVFQAGALDDPPAAVGLAEAVGDLLRTGGTLTRPAEEVDQEIDFMGASIDVTVGPELTSVSFSALSRDLEKVLALVSDLVRNPAFRKDRLNLEKAQMGEEIRRRWDNPGDIAELRLEDLVYGAASRWARRPTEHTLEPLSQRACRAFHAAHFTPGGTRLGLAGDLNAAQARRMVQTLFGRWRGPAARPRPHEEIKGGAAPGVYWIERDVPQAQVAVGHLGAPRLGPDHYALEVMNLIVGSGFTSRLFREVRTARGLAYHVGGRVGEGYDRGIFRVDLQTQPPQAAAALAAVRDVLQGLRESPPEAEEVRLAHDRQTNRFVFNFASPGAIVEQRIYRAALGYPADYLDTYLERIQAVGGEDVRRVARAHLQPDRLVTLVVGPESAVAPLRAAGTEVRRIPLDPEAPQTGPASQPAQP
jgi:zinc protease